MPQIVVGNEALSVKDVPGYFIDLTGVYKGVSASIEDKVSGFVFVESVIKKSNERIVAVCGLDRFTGNIFREYFPTSELVAGPSTIATTLANRGLAITAKQAGKLREYLSDYLEVFPTDRVFGSYAKTGWNTSDEGMHVFVLPNRFIGGGVSGTVFMPETQTPFHENIGEKGALEDWKEHVASKAKGNPMLMLAIGASFSAPLLHLLGQDGFGFHFFATSSKGKTITAQAAASVWGCGRAPTSGASSSYVRTWHSTPNAMEALAEAHNHIPFIIDEIGQNRAKDFGPLVYMLAGGAGKGAMNANRDLKVGRSWLNVMVSTGEESVMTMIEDTSGRPAKTGQLIRFIDLDVSEGLFPAIIPERTVAYADALREACANYYGSAGVKYLEYLAERLNGDGGYKQVLMDTFNISYDRLLNTHSKFLPEQKRALKRFALVETALIVARDAGCVGYDLTEIKASTMVAVNKWVETMPLVSEVDRAYAALRDYVVTYPNRVRSLGGGAISYSEVACYYSARETRYFFTEGMLKKIVERGNLSPILEALNKDGFLIRNNGADHWKTKVTIEGRRQSMIAIDARFFSESEEGDAADKAVDSVPPKLPSFGSDTHHAPVMIVSRQVPNQASTFTADSVPVARPSSVPSKPPF